VGGAVGGGVAAGVGFGFSGSTAQKNTSWPIFSAAVLHAPPLAIKMCAISGFAGMKCFATEKQ
jgi:hypothetical protein